jgi:hypothetical protein
MCSLGYLLVLVLLPKSFYLEKVMVLGGRSMPMVGWQYCDIVYGKTSTSNILTQAMEKSQNSEDVIKAYDSVTKIFGENPTPE